MAGGAFTADGLRRRNPTVVFDYKGPVAVGMPVAWRPPTDICVRSSLLYSLQIPRTTAPRRQMSDLPVNGFVKQLPCLSIILFRVAIKILNSLKALIKGLDTGRASFPQASLLP